MSELWNKLRRQPGSALFIVLYKTIFQLLRALWPALLILVMRSPGQEAKIDPWEIGIAVFLVLFLVRSVVLFFRFQFAVQDDQLLVRKGLFVRSQIIMPLDRVQAVHMDENWLHQLLDLSEVSIDSPGTEETEVRITMRKSEAEAFRQFISGHVKQNTGESEVAPAKPVQEDILFQLSTADLIKLGFSANHLEAFSILLAFAFSTLDNLERAIGFEFSGAMRWLSDTAASSTSAMLLMLAVAVLFISIVISVLRITLQYGRFVISETGERYRIQSGLINLKEKLVPFNKVQYISWKANWLRSKLPIYMLHFHASGDVNMKKKFTIRIPITRIDFVDKLLAFYHPAIPASQPYTRVDARYIFRKFLIQGFVPATVLFGIGYFRWEWNALIVFVYPFYVLLTAVLFQRKFRLYTDSEALQIHQGAFGREYIVLKWENIQSVALRQSIYQRRHRLATLRLYTADRYITIPFISLEDAEVIRDYAVAKIELD